LFVSAVSPELEEGGAVLAAVKDEPRSRAVACDDPWPPLRAAPCACCRPGRRNGAQPNRDTAVGGASGWCTHGFSVAGFDIAARKVSRCIGFLDWIKVDDFVRELPWRRPAVRRPGHRRAARAV